MLALDLTSTNAKPYLNLTSATPHAADRLPQLSCINIARRAVRSSAQKVVQQNDQSISHRSIFYSSLNLGITLFLLDLGLITT